MVGGVKGTLGLLVLGLAALLSACSTTRIDRGHSLIQSDAAESYANVYFIRPTTEHPLGFADNPLTVAVNGERLMRLGVGEYTLVQLKARDISVTMKNQTQVRGRWEVTEMEQTRNFNLEPGQTYYILAKMVNGEFRGVTFIPESITLFDVRQIKTSLRATGAAKKTPIYLR
ncbi:MAG: hypothetical protein U1B30_14965 [Pseudomonadota bacterium]|nr:hypothetical protein [Pseudomonadota bacterium]